MSKIPDFFGIEIGTSSIKLCETKKNGSRYEVSKIGYREIDSNLLKDKTPLGIDTLVNEIKAAGKESGIKTRNCVIAVPETLVFSKQINLPQLNENEIEEAIHWAAKSLVPTSLDDMNLAYIKIGDTKTGGKNTVDWYVVAVPKDIVNFYKDVIDKTGLNLLAIETEALALARLTNRNYQLNDSPILTVDIGAENTNMVVAMNGIPVFSQTVSTGSDSMTKVIMSDYGLDKIQADKYKSTFGINFNEGEGKIANSLKPVVDILKTNISRTLTYYKDKMGGQNISNIFLTGGGSLLPSLSEYIAQDLNTNVQVINELKNISVSSSLQNKLVENFITKFSITVGLSIKGK